MSILENTRIATALPEYVEVAAEEIFEALHTFLRYDSIPNPAGGSDLAWVSEIRIPAATETNPKTGKVYTNVEAAWFDRTGIEDIAIELASQWCQPPNQLTPDTKYAEGGIYWTINPITPAYLENYGSTLQRRRTGTARDVDVIARYWLPVDADATRRDPITGAPLAVVSSTAEEKAAIATLIAQVREWLVGTLGWPEPVQVDSGNGYCDYYALPGLPIPRCPDPANPGCLKYDAAADTLIRDVIHALSHKFTGELGSVDDAVFNPSRVMKIPGTFARKAKSTPERPHRASQILHIPQTIVPVSLAQLRTVAGQYQASAGAGGARGRGRSGSRGAGPSANGQATHTSPLPYTGPVEPATPAERARIKARAVAYLAQVPPAIAGVSNENGQKGHDATISGLGKFIRRFALPPKLALEIIAESGWNERCEPPWSERELQHKLDSIYADSRGADDWGMLLAEPTLANPPIPYLTHNHVLCAYHTEEDAEGNRRAAHLPLCNFDARIVASEATILGESTTIDYRIRASKPLPDGAIEHKAIRVAAAKFADMTWPLEQLGGDWAIGSGRGAKDRLREAIQLLSGRDGITRYTKYHHTGWIRAGDQDYYLHAGGAIGRRGTGATEQTGIVVDLDATLPLYKLPDPPEGGQLQGDVQATLRLRDLGRTGRPNARGIAAALVALPWRAVLGACNFTVVLAGGSGGCKTSLGCLVTQHFAPGHAYDSAHQAPVTWEATAAHIEWLAHRAKDTVLCVDNFIADAAKAQAQQAKAATILNNQGDLRGRERMGPDLRPLPSLSPRGGLLSTGEDTAARGSAKGRSLLVPVTRGETPECNSVTHATLTPLQTDAAAGAYARTMAAYIQHVAARGRDQVLTRLRELTATYHDRAAREGIRGHARTPGILADLAAGYRLFLDWAESLGVIDSAPAAAEEHWQWLGTLGADQAEQMEESDDALRWRDLVHSALGCGRAYLAGPDGKAPAGRQAECGWTRSIWKDEKSGKEVEHWQKPHGVRIGWFAEEHVYLDENETMVVVQQMAGQQNHQLSQPATLKTRLVEKGWLQLSTEAGKPRYTTKSPIPLEGTRRRVWKLTAPHFWPTE